MISTTTSRKTPVPVLSIYLRSLKTLHHKFGLYSLALAFCLSAGTALKGADAAQSGWQQCGWGGGGFYFSTVYHPTKDGVIYMGSDVNGVYRTDDHGLHWKVINFGVADYGVFSLAVDKSNPDTVYAATGLGLCKSTDEGEHWQLLPLTGPKDLHITGEKHHSIRCIAVDPSDGNIVYAASPIGKVYKSTDGGQTWSVSYTPATQATEPGVTRVQFGKVNGLAFGGFWFPVKFPGDAKPEECAGIGFDFLGSSTQPKPHTCNVLLKTATGVTYRSKDLSDLFASDQKQTTLLSPTDFTVDPDFAKAHPDLAKSAPATPDWASVTRLDLGCSGSLDQEVYVGKFSKFYYAQNTTAAGQTTPSQILVPMKDLSDKDVQTYANIHIGEKANGPIYTVAIDPKTPSRVIAATSFAGLILSEDSGATWQALNTPKNASSAAFAPGDPNTIYGTFYTDGIQKTTDKGKTWSNITPADFPKDFSCTEIVVSPDNPLDVYLVGAVATWGGGFYYSHDGGTTWGRSTTVTIDREANPTLDGVHGKTATLSGPSNIAIDPLNSKELFISANWRPCLSEDSGVTWTERDRGADITCTTDIRFSGNRTYVTAMDEGAFVSEDDGNSWKQLWPDKFAFDLSGHNWRIAAIPVDGVDHLIATVSPWNLTFAPRVVVSEDGGKTYKITTSGLPDYLLQANTMWGEGHPRAMAVDPNNAQVIYLGIDGDATPGKIGGGIFKSVDGGNTWLQLPNQPGSRRVVSALAVDPTDSERIYWGCCGKGGGLYESEDGGETWKNVFHQSEWIFNVLVAPDGAVYCPTNNLWRSKDHGKTWEQLTHFTATGSKVLCALEVDPRDPKTIWCGQCVWGATADGAVYKSIDDGVTWQDITGNLPHVGPEVLRFNPVTNELWAGWVGVYKIAQPSAKSTVTTAQ